jgi:hypothetical protein
VKQQLMMALLRSPLHSLFSSRTVLLTFKNRSTGRETTLPLAYTRIGQTVICFTQRSDDWWLNLRENAEVRVHLKDQALFGTARIVTSEDDRDLLVDRLTSTHRKLAYADAIDQAPKTVMIQISLGPETSPGDAQTLATE